MAKKKGLTGRVLHDPIEDRLTPIYPLDLSKARTVDELVRAMGQTAFTARQVGDAADVLEAMARDKDCFVVLTLSGAMTVAKMGLVFCDLIDSGIVKAVVSTGALMAHGLVEAAGKHHFRYDPKMVTRSFFSPATIAFTIPSNRSSISTTLRKSSKPFWTNGILASRSPVGRSIAPSENF